MNTIGVLDWSTTEWMERARCAGADPDVFFPGPSRRARVLVEQAKAICALCPTQLDCLRWALATEQDCGVWGGRSEEERRRLRRRLRCESIGGNAFAPLDPQP